MRRPPGEHTLPILDRSPGRKVGLARALSKLGLCSRSQAQVLIRTGRVKLNGAVRRDPETPVRLGRDRIALDDCRIRELTKVYFVLNKPRGVVTTASDEKGRKTVYELLEPDTPWVAPVGRLDKASEGLLLLTNDSEWAARVSAPESHLEKTYHVQVATLVNETVLTALLRGVQHDGNVLRAVRADMLRVGHRNSWVEIVLDEGKNRQIRRMFEALGIEVLSLVRVAIGPVPLGGLLRGQTRTLTRTEKLAIDRHIATAGRD